MFYHDVDKVCGMMSLGEAKRKDSTRLPNSGTCLRSRRSTCVTTAFEFKSGPAIRLWQSCHNQLSSVLYTCSATRPAACPLTRIQFSVALQSLMLICLDATTALVGIGGAADPQCTLST